MWRPFFEDMQNLIAIGIRWVIRGATADHYLSYG